MKQVQLTDTILMVSPDHFSFNAETAETNGFQSSPEKIGITKQSLARVAIKEFESMVALLKKNNIAVYTLPSKKDFITPDAVFPNNWFTHDSQNNIILYPMLTPNRRAERQNDLLIPLITSLTGKKPRLTDLTDFEKKGEFLEGTGSLILDRVKKFAFAMESPRTTPVLFKKWCSDLGYEGFLFRAFDRENKAVYHTNVFMTLGEKFIVACIDAIHDPSERIAFINQVTKLGKELIPISFQQMYSFCGNIIQLRTKKNEKVIILSQTADYAFTPKQKGLLSAHGKLIPVNIATIETIGGGSARCMIAELFVS